MKRERVEELLRRFPAERIAVIGDLFLDKWVTVDPKLDEPSVETGKTAFQAVKTVCAAGAAGTVLNTLSTLGTGKLFVVSLIGNDGDGFEVKKALRARGVDLSRLIEDDRIVTPTYLKPVFLQEDGSAPVEGNRIDFKNRAKTPRDLEDAVIDRIRGLLPEVDALVVLDQLTEADTGVVTTRVREALHAIAQENPDLLVYADSRAFIHLFRGMTIKCNNYEALEMAGCPETKNFVPEEVFGALDALEQLTGKPAIVTCNVHGVAVREGDKHLVMPASKQTGPIDVVGAGDACSAGLVTALCAGASLSEAATFGNLCSGVTVRKLGTTGTASPEEVLALFDEQPERFDPER
ncbi:MAG: PfkB family carbohydrate kinase [Clostridia bacterium]|nr:PfkB family carbohydrate kinase [Clostridia bacterium]